MRIDERLQGKRVLVYLGTLERTRHIERLFEMMALLRTRVPDARLVLVGDAEEAADPCSAISVSAICGKQNPAGCASSSPRSNCRRSCPPCPPSAPKTPWR